MSRISIDVTEDQHQKLKALAALRGQSIKDFVLERTLGPDGADAELEALLDKRLANARAGGVSSRSVDDVVEQVKRDVSGGTPNA